MVTERPNIPAKIIVNNFKCARLSLEKDAATRIRSAKFGLTPVRSSLEAYISIRADFAAGNDSPIFANQYGKEVFSEF